MIRTLAFALIFMPAIALAQVQLDTTAPQAQMHNRISSAVDRRAKELRLDQDVVTYCRIELNRQTDEFPKNGSIPFGVNYNQITDKSQLDLVISARESYEKTFMLSCLGRAKRDLAGAE